MGGRGASSGSTSLFGGQGGNNGPDRTVYDLPARMNRMYNGNNQSIENTISVFEREHGNSDMEHAVIYDDDGFVYTYKHGNEGSVSFYKGELKGKNVIHNHPNGSNFSLADMTTMASEGANSIVATNTNGKRYTLKATSKADSAGFIKAVSNAKTTGDVSTLEGYNRAVGRWLKANAGKHGYEYSEE